MYKKAWLSGLALAAAVGGFSTASVAGVNAQIAINLGPPPMRQELRPAPRRGMVWTPGFWNWQGNRHVWVQGHWVRERPGYRWVEPNWVSHNGRWILVQGYWANGRVGPRGDRDNDGVRNRNDRDRDGDGIPNRRDRHPDNPRRN